MSQRVPPRPVRHADGTPDMRFPLPLDEIVALALGAHWSLVRDLQALGLDREDLVGEVLRGLAARKGYDPSRSGNPATYVVHVAKCVLLNVREKTLQPIRAPGGRPEVPVAFGLWEPSGRLELPEDPPLEEEPPPSPAGRRGARRYQSCEGGRTCTRRGAEWPRE